jgi:hypothetical protein
MESPSRSYEGSQASPAGKPRKRDTHMKSMLTRYMTAVGEDSKPSNKNPDQRSLGIIEDSKEQIEGSYDPEDDYSPAPDHASPPNIAADAPQTRRKKKPRVKTYDFMAKKLENIDLHCSTVKDQRREIKTSKRNNFFFEIDKVNVTRGLRKALIESFLKRDLYDLQCKRWVVFLRVV